jgi:hypothetical protein
MREISHIAGEYEEHNPIECSPIEIALSLASNVNRRAMEYVVTKVDRKYIEMELFIMDAMGVR